ncbi:MAG: diaminopimelate epimerase, partial [Syntrophales bacterium]
GIIEAEVRGDTVKVKLTKPQAMKINIPVMLEDRPLEVSFINTGVPHVVLLVDGLDRYDVFNVGRKIRYHKEFQPEGTNANFMEVIDRHVIRIRTYERGVEDETLACGTGAVASALISSSRGLVESPVDVKVQSGETLKIYFDKLDQSFEDIYLEGKANVVYEGRIWDEAFKR